MTNLDRSETLRRIATNQLRIATLVNDLTRSASILTADIDVGAIAEGKFDLDVVGHYARPDVFRLTVNERAARAAEFEKD